MKTLPMLLAATLTLSAQVQAQAQQVYRCGPDGREYSQAPCKDGRAVDAADPRSAADQKAARDVAAREGKLADEMTRERQAREAAAAKEQNAAKVKPARPAASAPHPKPATKKSQAASAGDGKMSPPMRLPATPNAK